MKTEKKSWGYESFVLTLLQTEQHALLLLFCFLPLFCFVFKTSSLFAVYPDLLLSV